MHAEKSNHTVSRMARLLERFPVGVLRLGQAGVLDAGDQGRED